MLWTKSVEVEGLISDRISEKACEYKTKEGTLRSSE